MAELKSKPGRALRGRARVPGDKSISHRALILAALASGTSRLMGLSEGEDVANTSAALAALGVPIRQKGGTTLVLGRGLGGFAPPGRPLHMGNSGTGLRLLLGALTAQGLSVEFQGDASLSRRPLGALLEPLRRMGARTAPTDAETLPLTFTGTRDSIPIICKLPAPSAQIKSAILIAGLNTMGTTTVVEPFPTRDHTEILLKIFRARMRARKEGKGKRLSVEGWNELRASAVSIPGDVSAAAFIVGAAAMVPGSRVSIENVGLNPTRTHFLKILKRMGADVTVSRRRVLSGEGRGTIRVRFSPVRAVTTSAVEAPALIDEFPMLFALAAVAKGVSRFHGLGALREKESDRLAAMAGVLRANGVEADVTGGALSVHGTGGIIPGGGRVEAALDHRVAMASSLLGLAAARPVLVAGAETIATSFPGFVTIMRALGADMKFTRKGRP